MDESLKSRPIYFLVRITRKGRFCNYLTCLLIGQFCKKKTPTTINKQDIKSFMTYLAIKQKPESLLISYAKSLRFFLEEVLPNMNIKKYTLENNNRRHDKADPREVYIKNRPS